MKVVSIAEAKSRFSDLISRAAAGERFLIQRRKRPMAVLVSAAEWERLERSAQAARQLALALGQDKDLLSQIEAGEAHPAMAAFGLWRDEEELAALAEEINADREHQGSRAEVAL